MAIVPYIFNPRTSVSDFVRAARDPSGIAIKQRELRHFFNAPGDKGMLYDAITQLYGISGRSTVMRQKEILKGARNDSVISGLGSLSLYMLVNGEPILSYSSGKRNFIPTINLKNGIYSIGRNVITFPPSLYEAAIFSTENFAQRDIAVLPICSDQQLGMLVAESEPGKHMKLIGSKHIRTTIEYFTKVAELYATVMSTWFNATTGLPDKKFFVPEVIPSIGLWLERGWKFTMLLIDLDDFKQVNDRFGHDAGDMALKEVANALLECTRRSASGVLSSGEIGNGDLRRDDLVIHWGGDEFLVIVQGTDNPQDAIPLARRIKQSVEEIRCGAQGEVRFTTSVGMVTSNNLLRDPNNIMGMLDEALYASKGQTNKNRLSFLEDNGSVVTLTNGN
ncbi:GGDEF domain-containing protein [Candidatus Micrarchaeota archaeon]|nr:GGDEF domain-containing protein [Candidatus Micrarchaeota archaeon]